MSLAKRFNTLSVSEDKDEISADILECPVCLDICKPPSYECANGHLVCGLCRLSGRIMICPVCRDSNLQESQSLKSYLEKCIFTCTYEEYGCNAKFNGELLKSHENRCIFRPTKCPFQSCELLISKNDLENHVVTKHPDKVKAFKTSSKSEPGCIHYKRHCKLLCPFPECGEIVSCRECHDTKIKAHKFNRFAVSRVICCSCGKSQTPAKKCERCHQQFARYFCARCNLYDDNSTELDIFHCDRCGICRRKKSRDEEYYHCSRCDICVLQSIQNTHKNASKKFCGYCEKDMHSSRTPIVLMTCGHYIHTTCRDEQPPGQAELNCRDCNGS